MQVRSALSGVLVTAALFGCGPVAHHANPTAARTPATESTLADEVAVTCSRGGITVNAVRIRTRPSGVALRITSSLPRGSYLSYASTGAGGVTGGDPIERGSQRRTLALSPGTVTLGCDPVGRMGRGQKATLQVTDPDANWRGTRELDALGCSGSGIIDWALGFVTHSVSPQSAAEAVAQNFQTWSTRAAGSEQFTVRPLAVGYRGDSTQTWLLMKAGAPYASVLVRHAQGRYDAGPDASCTLH